VFGQKSITGVIDLKDICLIGITGNRYSGKSLCGLFLRKKGIPVVDLDDMYLEMAGPGNILHKKLILSLGGSVMDKYGNIDLAKLSLMICNERWVELLIDDIMSECMNNVVCNMADYFISKKYGFVAMESIALIGNSIENKFSQMIIVTSKHNEMKKRMLAASLTEKASNAMLKKNVLDGLGFKNKKSYHILSNNKTPDDFKKSTLEALDIIYEEETNKRKKR